MVVKVDKRHQMEDIVQQQRQHYCKTIKHNDRGKVLTDCDSTII
jgi:hypothetical protein